MVCLLVCLLSELHLPKYASFPLEYIIIYGRCSDPWAWRSSCLPEFGGSSCIFLKSCINLLWDGVAILINIHFQYSNKVSVLHWHVETLFQHWTICWHVGSRTHMIVSASVLNVWLTSLLEFLFTSTKNNWVFKVLIPWLTKTFRSVIYAFVACWIVLSRARSEWQGLAKEDLIEIEAWRSLIKGNLLISVLFKVSCSVLFLIPILACVVNT